MKATIWILYIMMWLTGVGLPICAAVLVMSGRIILVDYFIAALAVWAAGYHMVYLVKNPPWKMYL